MRSQRGRERPPPSGGRRQERPVSYSRAVAVTVAAVALGVYLLTLGGGHGPGAAAAPPPASTTTTTTAPPATTTTLEQPTTAVKVLVANASTTNGVAGYYTSKLASAGWGMLTATNATSQQATSTVYYASGEQQAALSVASSLGVPASAVQPIGSTIPVQGITGAAVVVVAGDDLAAKATPATAG